MSTEESRLEFEDAPHDALLSRLREVLPEFEWMPNVEPQSPVPQPEPELAPGFFVLADFLCDRCGIPRGSLVNDGGFSDALSGRKPRIGKRKKKAATKFSEDERSKLCHTKQRQSRHGRRPKMNSNVSESANAAFLQEVKETDPARFARLAKVDPSARAMQPAVEGWRVGSCERCANAIIGAPFVERGRHTGDGKEYCSRACRSGVAPFRGLCARKYDSNAEREAARKEQDRARKASRRLEKVA